jgi:drug/metabolite transporter (DMT)-like permease
MSSAPHQRVDKVPLGILYMLGATFVFSISTAMSKWQVDTYSFAEVLCFRSIGSFAICSLLILPRTGLSVFRTRHLGQHFGRSTTQATAQSCIMLALGFMPLAGAVAINFSSPLFAALASVLWLKEKIGKERLAALLVGFCGVLLVAGPGADSFRIGALFALGNAVLLGSVTAAVRGMSKTESAETLTMFQMVILTVFFTIAMVLFGFITPTWQDAGLMLVNGIFNGLGQYWWTRSLSLAPASAVGPFYYFSMVFALIIGFVVWGDIPTPALLAGAAIVVASGLYLLWHESRKRASITAEEPLD